MFTRFGGLTDARVKAQVARGERIRALITQPRFAPLRPVDEIALLAALADGVFDVQPIECIAAVRAQLAAHLDAHGSATAVAALAATGTLDAATQAALVAAVRELVQQLAVPPPTEGASP
jgi:F-type H+-transporting ATPase subunit alpha